MSWVVSWNENYELSWVCKKNNAKWNSSECIKVLKIEIGERTICRGFLKKENFTTRIWSWEWLDEIAHKHTEVSPSGGRARVRLIETLPKLLREVFSSAHHFWFPPLLTLSLPFGNSSLPFALTTYNNLTPWHVPLPVSLDRSNNLIY